MRIQPAKENRLLVVQLIIELGGKLEIVFVSGRVVGNLTGWTGRDATRSETLQKLIGNVHGGRGIKRRVDHVTDEGRLQRHRSVGGPVTGQHRRGRNVGDGVVGILMRIRTLESEEEE